LLWVLNFNFVVPVVVPVRSLLGSTQKYS